MTKKKVQYLRMPIKATPYKHQRAAFDFVCGMFGLANDDGTGDGSENGGDAVENHQE